MPQVGGYGTPPISVTPPRRCGLTPRGEGTLTPSLATRIRRNRRRTCSRRSTVGLAPDPFDACSIRSKVTTMRPCALSFPAAIVAAAALTTGMAASIPAADAAHAAAPVALAHRAAAPKSHANLTVTDPRGDVTARTGTPSDLDGSADGFKPGTGTAIAPTAADEAMDLTRVHYRIVRTGKTPVLKVTYRVAGTFSHSEKTSSAAGAVTDTFEADGVATSFAHGYVLQTENDGYPSDTGLMNKKGKKLACKGFHTTMKAGTHVATQVIPLGCLAKAHVGASRMQAVAAHFSATATATSAGVSTRLAIASDPAAKTKRVSLKP